MNPTLNYLEFRLVLTFDFAFGKRQREHPHKLSDLIVKERANPGRSRNSPLAVSRGRPTSIQAIGAHVTAQGCL